jgi:hypothetical protein
MRKLRGLCLVLGLAALVGVRAPEARAAGISMTIAWDATSIDFNSVTPSIFVLPGSDNKTLLVDLGAVNGALVGSAINFSALGATSNNPGDPTTSPPSATLDETATGFVIAGPGTRVITVTTNQDSFSIPSGLPGKLESLQTSIFTNANPGNTAATSSSYNLTDTPTLTSITTGTDNFSPKNSVNIPLIAASYSLDNTATLDLTGAPVGGKLQAGVSAKLTGAIPEPASLVMMLTGMPLPLVVLGLLRRRRAAA